MKNKIFLFAPIVAAALASCSQSGVRHDTSEYILSLAYKSDFRILQLTDPHMGDKDDQDEHFKFMDLTINDAKPDLIVATGDLFTFASKGTMKRFYEWLDSHDVPWTVTFGNHDEQCYFSVDYMTSYLNEFGSNCLFKDIQDDDITGNANFAINLMNGEKVHEQVIIMDSNRYYYGDYNGYDYIKPNQIEWYKRLVDYTTEQNGGLVDSLIFHHIPLPEIDAAYEYGEKNNAIEFGEKREKTCPPDYNSGFFDVIKEKGSTKGLYFGHDHVNDFRVTYEGVTFAYGIKSTDRIYYDEDMLGGQVIVVKDDHSLSYEPIFHKYSEVK